MTWSSDRDRKAIIAVPIAVLTVVGAFLLMGYIVGLLLQIPLELGLPLPARLFGGVLIAISAALWIWLFRYRRPIDVLISTFLTFSKFLRKVELREDLGRRERLVVIGPYKLVRHPMYLAVLLSLSGWGLLLDLAFIVFGAVIALLWFNFVVMPHEERELLALFGEDYAQYMRQVRRLLPIPRSLRRRPPKAKAHKGARECSSVSAERMGSTF